MKLYDIKFKAKFLSIVGGVLLMMIISVGISTMQFYAISRVQTLYREMQRGKNYFIQGDLMLERYKFTYQEEDYKALLAYFDTAKMVWEPLFQEELFQKHFHWDGERLTKAVKRFNEAKITELHWINTMEKQSEAVATAFTVQGNQIIQLADYMRIRMDVRDYFSSGDLVILDDAALRFTQLMKQVSPDVRQALQPYNASYNELVAAAKEGHAALYDLEESVVYLDKELANIHSILEKVIDEKRNVMVTTLILSLLIVIALGGGLTNWISNAIVRSLGEAVTSLERVASGDIGVTFTNKMLVRKDEIGALGRGLKHMVDQLHIIIQQIKEGAMQVAKASEQLNVASMQVSQGTTSQAASAEELSSAMEQMAATIDHNADTALETEKVSQNMRKQVENTALETREVVQAVHHITQRIAVISDIAEQTNILALNAAVEAARAGEHGRGFAVVAAEVRKLAENSREAALEVTSLVGSATQSSKKTGENMDLLLPDVLNAAERMSEITQATVEQRSGVNQINSAVLQMNNVVQQNAASAEEMATSSEELSSQADQLLQTISYFHA